MNTVKQDILVVTVCAAALLLAAEPRPVDMDGGLARTRMELPAPAKAKPGVVRSITGTTGMVTAPAFTSTSSTWTPVLTATSTAVSGYPMACTQGTNGVYLCGSGGSGR